MHIDDYRDRIQRDSVIITKSIHNLRSHYNESVALASLDLILLFKGVIVRPCYDLQNGMIQAWIPKSLINPKHRACDITSGASVLARGTYTYKSIPRNLSFYVNFIYEYDATCNMARCVKNLGYDREGYPQPRAWEAYTSHIVEIGKGLNVKT